MAPKSSARGCLRDVVFVFNVVVADDEAVSFVTVIVIFHHILVNFGNTLALGFHGNGDPGEDRRDVGSADGTARFPIHPFFYAPEMKTMPARQPGVR